MIEPVHFSHLKHMANSPAHYRHALIDRRDTKSFRMGRAVHSFLLGGPEPIVYNGRRAGSAWEAFAEEHSDCEILIASEAEPAFRMRDALHRNAEAMDLLRSGAREKKIDWSFLGRACQGTPDVFNDVQTVELKTDRSAKPARFQSRSLWYAYHAQHAWYMNGIKQAGLGRPGSAYTVAVESSAPYPVTIFRLTERAIEQGHKLYRGWMERLLGCEAANHWPEYCESIVDLDVPDDDFELNFGEDAAQ